MIDIVEVQDGEFISLGDMPEPFNKLTPTKEHRLFVVNIVGVPPSVIQIDRTMDPEQVDERLREEVRLLVKRENRPIVA